MDPPIRSELKRISEWYSSESSGCNSLWSEAALVVPSALLVLYLGFQARCNVKKLSHRKSFVMIAYYALNMVFGSSQIDVVYASATAKDEFHAGVSVPCEQFCWTVLASNGNGGFSQFEFSTQSKRGTSLHSAKDDTSPNEATSFIAKCTHCYPVLPQEEADCRRRSCGTIAGARLPSLDQNQCRKGKDLYWWMSKCPNGPSAKFLVNAVHTMEELKLTGNHLKGSRPLLTFSSNIDKIPQWQLLKEMIYQWEELQGEFEQLRILEIA